MKSEALEKPISTKVIPIHSPVSPNKVMVISTVRVSATCYAPMNAR
jgi:hypothetical protein